MDGRRARTAHTSRIAARGLARGGDDLARTDRDGARAHDPLGVEHAAERAHDAREHHARTAHDAHRVGVALRGERRDGLPVHPLEAGEPPGATSPDSIAAAAHSTMRAPRPTAVPTRSTWSNAWIAPARAGLS